MSIMLIEHSKADRWRILLARKAARSAVVQRQRGSDANARALYYEAHSLLRALRQHLRAA